MAGLLDDMNAARMRQAQGAMSHRKFDPVTGRTLADAAQSVGLLASPVPVVGDVMGLLGDAAMYAAKPEERTWGNAALTALGALPFVPPAAGKVKKALEVTDEVRAARMQEQGYTRGMWRGGRSVADGAYYTPDAAAAADFAKRHGPESDVREYALRMQKPFDITAQFGPDDLKRVADVLAPYNKQAAKYLPDMAGDYRSGTMPGAALWQILKTQTGGNEQEILRALGYDAVNAGQEVIMLNRGNIRDANRAAFDPRQVGKVGPFLGVGGVGLLGLGGINDDSSR